MAQNRNKAAGESDVTSPGTEQELRFDDKTLKGKDCLELLTKRLFPRYPSQLFA